MAVFCEHRWIRQNFSILYRHRYRHRHVIIYKQDRFDAKIVSIRCGFTVNDIIRMQRNTLNLCTLSMKIACAQSSLPLTINYIRFFVQQFFWVSLMEWSLAVCTIYFRFIIAWSSAGFAVASHTTIVSQLA